MKQYNINSYIYVKIDEELFQDLKDNSEITDDYIQHCIKNNQIIINNTVYYKLQAHQFMNLFGKHLYNHNRINTDVLFDDSAISDFNLD